MKALRSIQGFTLVELLIVIMIIGILGGILVPKVGSTIRKAQDGTTRGNLGELRSVISIYYANNDGRFPTDNLDSLVPSYVASLPSVRSVGEHGDSNQVVTEIVLTDTGKWSYNNVVGEPGFGSIHIGCTHTDTLGNTWSLF
jgi:prepilin-type N-terminal cleavage/methylation domain-containing protein